MLKIYYGDAKNKNRLCIGAAVLAAVKERHVLFVQFVRGAETDNKLLCDHASNIMYMEPEIPISLDNLDKDKRVQVERSATEFFDRAVRMALTFKYEVLLLDRIFDMVEEDLLPVSQVYEFLSDAPDRVEIICTGDAVEDRFISLADEAVEMTDTKLKS